MPWDERVEDKTSMNKICTSETSPVTSTGRNRRWGAEGRRGASFFLSPPHTSSAVMPTQVGLIPTRRGASLKIVIKKTHTHTQASNPIIQISASWYCTWGQSVFSWHIYSVKKSVMQWRVCKHTVHTHISPSQRRPSLTALNPKAQPSALQAYNTFPHIKLILTLVLTLNAIQIL